MANEKPRRAQHASDTAPTHRRRRRRPRGVPKAVAIALIVVALVVGGGLGYLLGGRSDSSLLAEREEQIANANQRIDELESVLVDNGIDPNADVFDGAQSMLDPDVVSALTGADEPVNANNVFLDDSDALTSTPAPTAEPAVVAEFGDVQIMSNEVIDAYNAEVNRQLLNGQDVSAYADSLMDETLDSIVTEYVKRAKAEELGLTTLTAEDEAAIDEAVQARFEQDLAFYTRNNGTMTAEEARADAIESMASDGITEETIRAEIEAEWWEEKLRDYATQNITVSDEQIQQTYEDDLAEQRTAYDANPGQYEYARLYGETVVVYNPAGYRTFKQVLIPFDVTSSMRVNEIIFTLDSLDETEDAEQIATLNAELDTLYADLETTAAEVLNRVAEGADFDDLIAEYSQDPQYELASVQSDGYYISEASTTYDAAIKTAVMALENPGDVSEPVRTSEGVHILYFNAEVPAGDIPLDDVRDALEAEALESQRYDAYEAQLAQWVEEANVTYHREVLEQNV